jgi:CRP/FNR family transcriptional regulator, cyclic AMP receptor protein
MTAINILRGEKDIRHFSAGQTVFAEGTPADGMYAVLDGEVDIVMEGKVRETVRQGGFFGELALLDDHPRSATAVARTNSIVAVVNAKRFETLVQQTPFFALQVMQVMAERLRRKDMMG